VTNEVTHAFVRAQMWPPLREGGTTSRCIIWRVFAKITGLGKEDFHGRIFEENDYQRGSVSPNVHLELHCQFAQRHQKLLVDNVFCGHIRSAFSAEYHLEM
jgi:hypothetical protein